MALKLKRFLGWRSPALVVAFLLATSGARAATLNVVGGILYGASDVDVGGTLYDVMFVDGSCITLFSGCDDSTDFFFHTFAGAGAASQALLDQVFLDTVQGSFDTMPQSIAGCSSSVVCSAWTPYSVAGTLLSSRTAQNYAAQPDGVGSINSLRTQVLAPEDEARMTFAVWTVPEPSTGVLLGLGFAGMSSRLRGRRSR
jgi:hypothetical protein